MKKRIAKWIFTEVTSILALFDARTYDPKKENTPVAKVDLTEIPGWETLPEYAKEALQFGVRQGASDGWGAKELTADQKLEGMASDLLDYTSATHARAKGKREEQISVSSITSKAWSLADLRFMRSDFFPKMGKEMPAEMLTKLNELEKVTAEHKSPKK